MQRDYVFATGSNGVLAGGPSKNGFAGRFPLHLQWV